MLDIAYRPLKFADVLGQPGTVSVLKARLRSGTASDTSYILSGGFGNGKTTLARILARAILCQDLNKDDPEPCNKCESCRDFLAEESSAYQEVDAASKGTIDKVRALVDELSFTTFGGNSKRIYTIDETHRMSRDGQDVLLKPLEEKRLVAIFCTTEPDKIRGAIRSRCEEHFIRRATEDEICERVRYILSSENIAFDDDAIRTVISYCDGHIRDVLNRLGTISQLGPVSVEAIRANLHLGVVPLYYEVLLALDDPQKAVETVERILETEAPEDVSVGLAEAAMNAFRLAHKLRANFVSVDRKLAGSLADKYKKDGLVRIANYFARSKHTTSVGVVCDILSVLQTDRTTQERLSIVVNSTTISDTAQVSQSTNPAPNPAQVSQSTNPVPNTNEVSQSTNPTSLRELVCKEPLTIYDRRRVDQPLPRGNHTQIKCNFQNSDNEYDLIPADKFVALLDQ